MYARLRPKRSPILLPIRMKAAETSASSAIADCTPLAVVSRSWTTAEIETFISDVSTTSTNIAIASRIATSLSPLDSTGAATVDSTAIRALWRWRRPVASSRLHYGASCSALQPSRARVNLRRSCRRSSRCCQSSIASGSST